MKTKRKTVGLVLALFAATMVGGSVSAWGPERPTYTNENPAEHAVFNSITNNAAVGDERDFVRIAEIKSDGSDIYRNEIELETGKDYSVYIYYHNDASETFNDAAHNYVGVAQNVRVSTNFPDELKAGQRGVVTGRISSTNTQPEAVWDEAYVTAKENMTLHFVASSARIYNQWGANNTVLSRYIFTKEGVFLGQDKLNGIIFGCERFSGQVIYTIRTEAVDKPVEPEPTPDPEPEPDPEEPTPEPELPDEPDVPTVEPVEELPTAGAHEAVLAIVVVVALMAGVIYWRTTSHAVRKATRHAKGRK